MSGLEDVESGDLEKLVTLPVFGDAGEVALVSFTLVLEDIAIPGPGTSLFGET